MGNCPAFHRSKDPDPRNPNKNICTVYEEGKYDPSNAQNNAISNSAYLIPSNLCISFDQSGNIDNYVIDYCDNIGDASEWIVSGDPFDQLTSEGSCLYDDSNGKTRITGLPTGGCCGPRCAISGRLIKCQRKAFNADPIPCCFLDYSCANDNGIKDACWQTSNRRKTCDPRYRDLSSQACLEKIKPYCTGEKLFAGQNNWMEAWIPGSQVDVNSGEDSATVITPDNQRFLKQPCLRALARAVYDDSGGVCTWEQFEKLDVFQGLIKPDGLLWAQDVIDAILALYIKEYGSPIGKINQDGYLGSSNFLDFYYSLCKKFPLICQRSLGNLCAGVKKEDLIESPEMLKWCGCYMKDSEYQDYEKFSIDRQCTPACNSQGNIPLVGEDNVPLVCTQTTCIIDDLSINLARVSNPDGVDFNQICNSCGQSKISKYFDGSNESDSKNTSGPNFFISGGTGTLEQFIPDGAASKGVSFWYNIKYDDGIYDQDDLLIRLQQCADTSRFTYFHPIKGSDDPIVTLNYESQHFTDFNGQGSGNLYYVSGIKKIYYGGTIKTDPLSPASFAGVNSFLNTTSKVSTSTGLCFNNFKSDSSYYTDFSAAKVGGKSYNFSQYQAIAPFDWIANDVGKYFKPYAGGNVTINGLTFITNHPDDFFNFDLEDNTPVSTKPALWSCWDHYLALYPLSIISSQTIDNSVREDNIVEDSNTCSCLLTGTLSSTDSLIKKLNLYEKCGNSQCFDSGGNSIACGGNGSNSGGQSDKISIIDSIKSFEKNIVNDKRELITVVLIGILLILIIVWVVLQYRKKK